MYIHKHSIRAKHNRRWFLWLGKFEFAVEVATHWRLGFTATVGYGGQESFAKWCLAVPGIFLHFRLGTPFSWHRVRPWDGKYGESGAEFGLRATGGTLRLLFGHDPMGTWYSTHGRWNWFRRGWLLNREQTLFDIDWILGRPRHSRKELEAGIPVTVDVGQWDGDVYHGTASLGVYTKKSRFRTTTFESFTIDMQEGIPFPGKGENSWDCGDDATYGFGGTSIESAVAHIIEHTKTTRLRHGGQNWRPTEALSA